MCNRWRVPLGHNPCGGGASMKMHINDLVASYLQILPTWSRQVESTHKCCWVDHFPREKSIYKVSSFFSRKVNEFTFKRMTRKKDIKESLNSTCVECGVPDPSPHTPQDIAPLASHVVPSYLWEKGVLSVCSLPFSMSVQALRKVEDQQRTVIWNYKEPSVLVFILFQNQRIVSFGSLTTYQNERTVGPGYFKNLKELMVLLKELAINWWFLWKNWWWIYG